MAEADPRIYQRRDVVAFRKTNEHFGGLSNMAPGFPIRILDVRIFTAEAIYQACRFPHMPKVQKLIIAQTSPMTAKMRAKPYRDDSRSDWDAVRVPIMKWCLRVKLLQNWDKFSALLLETGDRPIVEDSRKDDFWGATPDDDGILRGRNVLGRLLMELREKLKADPVSLQNVSPVPIPDFLLFSREIPAIARDISIESIKPEASKETAPLLNLFATDETRLDIFQAPAGAQYLAEPELAEVSTVQLDVPSVGGKRRLRLVWLGLGGIVLAVAVWLAIT
jgi:ribA/ribD-fused uncharacterized protein